VKLDGWQELDASSRRSNKMAKNWRDLCPAVECSGLMMMMRIRVGARGGSEYSRKADPGSFPIRVKGETEEF
jgi:hypothetical protein